MAYTDQYLSRNPEEIATSLMEKVLQGDTSSLDAFLKHEIHPGLLGHILDKLKAEGNRAVKQGAYREAIEFYHQALVGVKNKKTRAILLGNVSYALLQLKETDKALTAAREAITECPEWSTGWYRAAQVFERRKEYNSALTIMKAALKRSSDDAKLEKFYQHLIPLAQKEKALERLSVDYTRFNFIDVGDSQDLTKEENVSEETCVEYAEHLTEKQKLQLNEILHIGSVSEITPTLCAFSLNNGVFELLTTGQSPCDTSREGTTQRILRFMTQGGKSYVTLNRSYKKIQSTDRVSHETIRAGLLHLFKMKSELLWPRRVTLQQLLYAPHVLQHYLDELNRLRLKLEKLHSNTALQWVFLGLGTSVPLTLVSQFEAERHHVIGCTHHTYPFSSWMAQRMLEVHGVKKRDHLKIVDKRIAQLTCGVSNLDALDAELCDVPSWREKPTVLVIDQECFDSTGVGHGIIVQLRDLYSRFLVSEDSACEAKTSLLTVPASMSLLVYGACLDPSPNTMKTYSSTLQTPPLSSTWNPDNYRVMTQGRWSPTWEPIHHTAYDIFEVHDSESPIHLLTQPVLLQRFVFHGAFQDLDRHLPLNTDMMTKQLVFTKSGVMNCFILKVMFNISTSQDDNALFNVYGAAAPAVLWITPTHVEEGTTQQFLYRLQNGCDIFMRLLVEHEGDQDDMRTITIPRWQYDVLGDTESLNKVNAVLDEAVTRCLQHKTSQLEKKSWMTSPSIKTSNVEVLLLNSCLGLSGVTALNSAARFFSSRGSRPHPSIHITCVESSTPHAITTKCFLGRHHRFMDEAILANEKAKHHPPKQWIHFSDSALSDTPKTPDTDQESITTAQQSLQMKTRYSVVHQHLYSLRPPDHSSCSSTQLAIKRFLNQPLDATLPSAWPIYELHSQADILVCQMIDCSLIGEGLLPFVAYAHEALVKANCRIIPCKARIYMAAVHLGFSAYNVSLEDNTTPIISSLRPSCWYKHLLGNIQLTLDQTEEKECVPLNMDSIAHDWMTEPVMVFEFNLDRPPKHDALLSLDPPSTQISTPYTTALKDGIIHAVVFWYEVDLEPKTALASTKEPKIPRGYSTRPKSIDAALDSQPRSIRSIQACYLLDDAVEFKKAEPVPLVAWHTRSNLGARWDQSKIPDFTLRVRTSFQVMKKDDPSVLLWQNCCTQYMTTIDQLATLLADEKENAPMIRNIADQVYQLVSRYPIEYEAYVEKEEILWFFLNLFA